MNECETKAKHCEECNLLHEEKAVCELKCEKCEKCEIGYSLFSYESTILPKIHHGNFRLISEYKQELEAKSDLYMGVLIGSILGRLIKTSIDKKNFYTSDLDILNRILG